MFLNSNKTKFFILLSTFSIALTGCTNAKYFEKECKLSNESVLTKASIKITKYFGGRSVPTTTNKEIEDAETLSKVWSSIKDLKYDEKEVSPTLNKDNLEEQVDYVLWFNDISTSFSYYEDIKNNYYINFNGGYHKANKINLKID